MNTTRFTLLILAAASCSAPDTSEITSDVVTLATSAAGGGTTGTGARSASITTGAGDLLVACASVSANGQAAPTMTDSAGGTYALLGRAAWQTTNNMVCYAREALLPGTSATLTLNTDTNTAGEIVILSFAGMSRTGAAAVRQFTSKANQPAGSLGSVTFASSALTTNTTVVAIASGDISGVGTAPPSGWTERKDVHQSTPTTALEVATRASGFIGTTITFGGTQDTEYAVMGLELDTSAASPPVDAGVDAPHVDAAPDAPPADAAPDAGALGFSHGIVSQTYGSGHNPELLTRDTSAGGSTILIMMGGKTSDIVQGPSDNKGNTYALVGAEHDYANWPGYGTTIWEAASATGGTGHTWSQFVTAFDENTMFEVEIPGAGASPTITTAFSQHDNSGTYTPSHSTVSMTSGPVTTTGPATIIALWWGAGPTSYGDHIATPNNGFTTLDAWTHDDPNGYVQGYMAYKIVPGAGTYDVTWTYHPAQGAELWLIAVQP